MVKVLQNYKLEYAGDGDVGVSTQFISVPDKEVKIRFIKRE